MAAVELKQVRKQFGSHVVIPELDLEIRSGEFMVLVGPSGCGKSTLLRMIAGLEEVSSGTLSIGGRVVNSVSPKDRGVAMVFQSYALYPHMSVRQNLSFALKLSGLPKQDIENRVAEAAQVLGLNELMERKPAQLSGGQKQRVAMGRAMVRQPSVFLFDEPLSNLDAQLRVKMRSEISRLHRRLGCTVVYVTHDQVEAMTLADRIAVMYGGKIEQVGAPLEIYHNPKTRFVASFIGTPSMNFFPLKGLGSQFSIPAKADLVGFRPEVTYLGPAAPGRVSLGMAKVSLIELLGTTAHIHVDLNGTTLVAESKADSLPEVETSVEVSIDPSQVYYFNPHGTRISEGVLV